MDLGKSRRLFVCYGMQAQGELCYLLSGLLIGFAMQSTGAMRPWFAPLRVHSTRGVIASTVQFRGVSVESICLPSVVGMFPLEP